MELSKELSDKQFVFIVGAPRSGTTWIQSCLESHPEIASLPGVELRHFSEYLAPLFKVWDKEKDNIDKGRWTAGLPYIWSQQEFEQFIAEFTSRVYQKILEKRPTARIILDKHPGYSLSIKEILRVIPNAKFIHVIRDGRDAIISLMSAKKRIGFGYSEVDKASYYWRDCVMACRRAKEASPHQFLEVKYEDINADNRELKKILSFIGASSEDPIISAIVQENSKEKRYSAPDPSFESMRAKGKKVWKETLSREEQYILARICNPLLIELGYIEEGQNWEGSDSLFHLYMRGKQKIKQFLK